MIAKLNSKLIQPLRYLRDIGCTDAIIAGGAVRDTICKVPISDIDVYLSMDDFNTIRRHTDGGLVIDRGRFIDTLEHHIGVEFATLGTFRQNNISFRQYGSSTNTDGGYNSESGIAALVEVHIFGFKYQFMLLKGNVKPLDYVDRNFDYNLCRAWCDGYRLHGTNAFLNDWFNKTITLRSDATSIEKARSEKNHLPRLLAKYPNFRYQYDLLETHLPYPPNPSSSNIPF